MLGARNVDCWGNFQHRDGNYALPQCHSSALNQTRKIIQGWHTSPALAMLDGLSEQPKTLTKTPALTLLTIAIPTFNRAAFLALNLAQLEQELGNIDSSFAEVLICDNDSIDDTENVVDSAKARGMALRYVKNSENVGSDMNIAQCFNLALGDYVLILGDDDVLLDGTLAKILALVARRDVGVMSMRAYGYESNFRAERPLLPRPETLVFTNVDDFILKLGVYSTLISANVIGKCFLKETDARAFCGTSLVQTHLVYHAALAAPKNIYVDDYWAACKRDNSGNYPFSKIFVENLAIIFSGLVSAGIQARTIRRIETKMLLGFYPFSVWRLRRHNHPDLTDAWQRFTKNFGGRIAFWVFVAPVFWLPRTLALVWGGAASAVGRVATGDFRRGVYYLINWIAQKKRSR